MVGVGIPEPVDTVGRVGEFCSLDLDADGNPHISYYDATNGVLKYAHKEMGTWTTATVDSSGEMRTSLAVDQWGRVHIGYTTNGPQGNLRYATTSGGPWVIELVEQAGITSASLKVDYWGAARIAATRRIQEARVYYYVRTGSGWSADFVTYSSSYTACASLALHPIDGTPHISWESDESLYYATRVDTTWAGGRVQFGGRVHQPSIALDSAQDVLISFSDLCEPIHPDCGWNYPKLVKKSGGVWTGAVVDTTSRDTSYSSLAVDASGRPYIAYYDEALGMPVVVVNTGTEWARYYDPVAYPDWGSLVLDATGTPHVGYVMPPGGALCYAVKGDEGWTSEMVDPAGSADQRPSLALDGAGTPHMSYYDAYRRDLKYAFKDGDSWTIAVVDSAGDVGKSASMALDGSGNPHIAYYDQTNFDLKYAHRQQGSWMIETVDSDGNVGQYASLALDAAGVPHIGYSRGAVMYGSCKYASKPDGSWVIETVNPDGYWDYTHGISLALDADGIPHICHGINYDHFAYEVRSGGSWTLREQLLGYYYQTLSLTLNPAGDPYVVNQTSDPYNQVGVGYRTKVLGQWKGFAITPPASVPYHPRAARPDLALVGYQPHAVYTYWDEDGVESLQYAVCPHEGDAPLWVSASDDLGSGIAVSWDWAGDVPDLFGVARDDTLAFSGSDPDQRSWDDTAIEIGSSHSYSVVGYFDCDVGEASEAITGVRSPFLDIGASLTGVANGSAAWGDYDNDGDLDMLLTGAAGSGRISKVYRNSGAYYPTFTDIEAPLTAVWVSSVAWGDYDNDGDLDILLTGEDAGGMRIAKVYRNSGGEDPAFLDVGAALSGVEMSSVAWGDYDNDGDLDILLTGWTGYAPLAKVYRNSGGADPTFTDTGASLVGVRRSSVAWGDYDNDGDLDILLTGQDAGNVPVSKVYRNSGGANPTFTDAGASLAGVWQSSVAWGDYDNDGAPDILLTGLDVGGVPIAKVYRNSGGTDPTFSDVGAALPGVSASSVAWGDYDNDGDLDIVLTGLGVDGSRVGRMYESSGGANPSFSGIAASLRKAAGSSVAVGDFNNDGRLDVLVTGSDGSEKVAVLYRNQFLPQANHRPWPPKNLTADLAGTTATFHWDAPTPDLETPSAALTYNLRVGTSPGGSAVMPGMADPASGYRRVVQLGNTGHNMDWSVTLPDTGVYYWSVQTEDASFAGSEFAAERVLDTSPPMCEVSPTALDFGSVGVGTYADRSFVVRNGGGMYLVGGLSESCTEYSIVPGDYSFNLAAGESTVVTVRFSPTTEGTFPCTIETGAALCGDVECTGTAWAAFTDAAAGLPGVTESSVAWGDYDDDGDLDILLAGTGSTRISRVYRNDSGVFTDIGAGLMGVHRCSVAWGDYDNDGDLDILLAGYTGSSQITRIYRNDSGVFADIGSALTGVDNCSAAWGDYDNDGDLDVLLAGTPNSGSISRVYRNDSGVFTDIGAGLAGVSFCSAAWGDYDNDGDLDILLSGTGYSGVSSRVYRNDSGVFTDIGAGLTGVFSCSVAWGDYDNDGDLDILLAGATGSGMVTQVYRNDSGVFTDIDAGLMGVANCSAAWGDCDNDGDLDVLLAGYTVAARISRVYRNDGGSFSIVSAGLAGVDRCSVAWGDYDNDGDLDALLAGSNAGGTTAVTVLCRNKCPTPGTVPDSPANLSAEVTGNVATFHWDAAVDEETPAAGLTYNLRIGTASEGSQVMPGMANGATGYRRVVRLGNANHNTDWSVALPGDGHYYWSVQAEDASFAGSVFAAEQVVDVALPACSLSPEALDFGSVRVGGFADRTLVIRNSGGQYLTGTVSETCEAYSIVAGSGPFSLAAGESVAVVVRFSPNAVESYPCIIETGAALCGGVECAGAGWVPFTETATAFPGVDYADVTWGDYDNDGDLDVLLAGYTGSTRIAVIYRNDDCVFSDIGAGLDGVRDCSLAWGDYDNDGDLDVLLAGYTGSTRVAVVYRNDSGAFTDIAAGLAGVRDCSVVWGDCDNDGDLDILLAGQTNSANVALVYRNDDGVFVDMGAGLTGVYNCSGAWGDYDGDGDLDILLAGHTGSTRIALVYRNDSGVFAEIGAGLVGVSDCGAAWGDYDNDGDLDVLLAGDTGAALASRVYRNDNGLFVDAGAGLAGLYNGSAAWGDYDNDGDLDAILAGDTGSAPISLVYRNDSGIFVEIGAGITGVLDCGVAWGDYDNDGDLDVLLAGYSDGGALMTLLYANECLTQNTVPGSPTHLIGNLAGNAATFHWDAATDGETPSSGLTYNLYVGTTPAGCEVMPGMADTSTGYRRIVQMGNTNHNGDWTVTLPSEGVYYWSVQAVDAAFAGSPFATERLLTVCDVLPTALDFGSVAVGGSADRSFTIRNAGEDSLAGTVTEACGVYSIVAGSGPFNLAPNESLAVAVRFSPTAEGTFPCTIETGAALCTEVECTGVGWRLFTDIGAGLTGVMNCSVAWGDYDSDDDLDILLLGELAAGSVAVSRVYRNDGGVFVDASVGLANVDEGSAVWGDYDNDGDLDIFLSGWLNEVGPISRIYRNDGAAFVDIGAGLPGVYYSSAAWGDCDNDGDLDLLVSGNTNSEPRRIARIYRNTNGIFADAGAGLTGVDDGAVAWGDYDSDGDLDILLAGYTGSACISRIYRNNGGSFTDVGAGLVGVYWSAAAWGDYDSDGDLDVLLAGYTGSARISRVYRNDAGSFTDIVAALTGVSYCGAAWGDCDNDGDLDILLAGSAGATRITGVYRNDGGVFTDTAAGLTGARDCSVAWGDYDNDGDLDILLAGEMAGLPSVASVIYRNNCLTLNTVPGAPTNLGADVVGNAATFHWDAATDAETATAGLTYNLYVGTTPAGCQVMPRMANTSTGYRRVARLGNANHNTDWTVTLPGEGTYYWSAQAVDNAFAGSPFAAEQVLDTQLPLCSIGPDSLDFGGVAIGDSVDMTFAVRNVGGQLVAGTVTESCDVFDVIVGGGAYSLAAGESLTVTVRFSPTAEGTFPCTIETGAELCSDVECTGEGVPPPPVCDVSPGNLDFGDVSEREHVDKSFVVRNLGPANCEPLNGSIGWGDGPHDGYGVLQGGGPFSLASGESLTVTVQFTWVAPPDTRTCTIETGSGLCTDVACTAYCTTLFTEESVSLPAYYDGDNAWGDYDGDGYLDIVIVDAAHSEIYSTPAAASRGSTPVCQRPSTDRWRGVTTTTTRTSTSY